MAEEDADDEALYDVWRRLDEAQVQAIHELLEMLAERVREHRGRRPTREMIEAAMDLRDGPLGLGYLPAVQEVLDSA